MTKKLLIKISSTAFLFIALFGFFKGVTIYKNIYKPNIFIEKGKSVLVDIPTGSGFEDVIQILESEVTIKNKKSFLWVVKKKNYENKVKPGRFRIKNKMDNNQLVNMLRAGRQEPVKLTFSNVRMPSDLAKKIAAQIEASESEILKVLEDEKLIASLGFKKETFPAMFIPNTYEFFWNTTANEFVERMNKEYKRFWNDARTEKAKEIGLDPVEVSTLASIVDQETIKKEEKARIAGLYMNRLKRNIRLHADPTVKFALGNFEIKRVLSRHLKVESPYNTYRNGGLPPGPICYPSISAIDAVLNYEKHNYLYMCAKEDFSGYHNFAANITDHNRNAEKYRKALNKKRIYR